MSKTPNGDEQTFFHDNITGEDEEAWAAGAEQEEREMTG